MTGEPLTFRGVPVVFDESMETDKLHAVPTRRRFPFEDEADRLMPFAALGLNCCGPLDWRVREAVRQVLIQLDKEKNGDS